MICSINEEMTAVAVAGVAVAVVAVAANARRI